MNWVVWIPVIVVVVGSVTAGIFAIVNRRGGERAARKRLLPPTWAEMWARMEHQDQKIDELEQRMTARDRALANVLKAAARQWPSGHPGPTFDQKDLDVLGDTVPYEWIRRGLPPRPATSG